MESSQPVQKKPTKKYKVVFLGNQGVGKTSIIHRFLNNSFSSEYTVKWIKYKTIGDNWDRLFNKNVASRGKINKSGTMGHSRTRKI